MTYHKDDQNIADSKSFIFKARIRGRTSVTGNTKDVEIAVPWEYLGNFWRTLELPLINCKIDQVDRLLLSIQHKQEHLQ